MLGVVQADKPARGTSLVPVVQGRLKEKKNSISLTRGKKMVFKPRFCSPGSSSFQFHISGVGDCLKDLSESNALLTPLCGVQARQLFQDFAGLQWYLLPCRHPRFCQLASTRCTRSAPSTVRLALKRASSCTIVQEFFVLRQVRIFRQSSPHPVMLVFLSVTRRVFLNTLRLSLHPIFLFVPHRLFLLGRVSVVGLVGRVGCGSRWFCTRWGGRWGSPFFTHSVDPSTGEFMHHCTWQ